MEEPGGVESFVDEAFDLLRSQAASVLGNLGTVVPAGALVALGARGFLGRPLLPIAKADATLASLSLLGPTPLYAALTGILLFASSLFAGWLHNFFVFHDLENGIGHSPRLVHVLGRARAERVGRWLHENIAGLANSIRRAAVETLRGVKSVILILTTGCNLRCSYCYQNLRTRRVMNWSTIRAAVELLLASHQKRLRLMFLGGEPLLEFSSLRRAIEYAELRRARRHVRYTLSTNGTLMSSEVAEFLDQAGVEVQLSFDGVAPAQDYRAA